MSEKYKEEQKKRKRLNNELEDMKGKIRVYCRIRPLSKSELTEPERAIRCYKIVDEMTITIDPDSKMPVTFAFDSVFGEDSTQEDIFEDTERLVQSAIDGYNVCIFAYGQTGSGKTFTIQGSDEYPGLVPRSIVKLFEVLSTMTNYSHELSVYMVEIYLSELKDLLLKPGVAPKELEIKEDKTGRIVIKNVTIEPNIKSVEQLENIFNNGLKHRKVRSTKMNDASSRSHLIFAVEIKCQNMHTDQPATIGKLTFVDLAGSEKASKTGVSDEGAAEAIAINQSLSQLGLVIHALSTNAKQVPYRDNVLTRVMKDSLGGTAKTLMFVNCSPSQYNTAETKNSLRYAESAKKIVNKVSKGIESKEAQKYKQTISLLEE
jgi:hypothetical protein